MSELCGRTALKCGRQASVSTWASARLKNSSPLGSSSRSLLLKLSLVGGLRADRGDPFAQGGGDELRAIVRANIELARILKGRRSGRRRGGTRVELLEEHAAPGVRLFHGGVLDGSEAADLLRQSRELRRHR